MNDGIVFGENLEEVSTMTFDKKEKRKGKCNTCGKEATILEVHWIWKNEEYNYDEGYWNSICFCNDCHEKRVKNLEK